MSREEFAERFLENQVFVELKDSSIPGINYLRLKYQGTGIDFSRLYRRLINYQIKTYGRELRTHIRKYTKKERIEQSHRVKNAKKKQLCK